MREARVEATKKGKRAFDNYSRRGTKRRGCRLFTRRKSGGGIISLVSSERKERKGEEQEGHASVIVLFLITPEREREREREKERGGKRRPACHYVTR